LPIDPATKLPAKIAQDGKVVDPASGLTLPRKYDPKTSRVLDPSTKKPVCPAYDKLTGRPYNLESGKLYPINRFNKPYDPQSNKEFFGTFDALSGKPLDKDGNTITHSKFDENTGRPLDKNGKEIPLNADGFPVIDGKVFPQRFDPILSVKTDDEGLTVAPLRYSPNTGLPTDIVYE